MATDSKSCSVYSCNRPTIARGWCDMHYRRWRAHGDPLGGGTPNGEPLKYLSDVVLAYDGDECLIWPYSKNNRGYAQLTYEGRFQLTTRIVCARVNGPPPSSKHEAAHSCGNGHLSCVTPRHLSWKTRSENHMDKIIHGTHDRGERNPRCKLTEAQVREIRRLHGLKQQKHIAADFGISGSAVSLIQSRTNWAWLD